MKIYHCVESYYPAVGGMQEVVKQLSERLVKLGHEVTVLTRKHDKREFKELNGVKIIEFAIDGNPIIPVKPEDHRYISFLLELKGDVITFFAAQQWATNLALPILQKIALKKVSVPTGYSGLYWPTFKKYYEDMKQFIHHYDMNVYLSDDYRDINYARDNGVKNLTLIPNGAAEDEFLAEDKINIRKELGLKESDFILLLVGSYTGWKGHKEAIEMFLNIKTENVVLLMIGNNYQYFRISPKKQPVLFFKYFWNKCFGKKKIIFNFYSREFTVAAYKQANLFLFPSNVECSPIVLFECAAAKLPFLATDVGNSVEIAEWTKGGKILPTTKDNDGFSHAVIGESVKILDKMINDKSELVRMAGESHKIWKEKYSWEHITKMYERLYQDLIK